MDRNGCAFGQVTREITNEIRNNVVEIKDKIDNLDTKMTDLYNHQSNRVPIWVTALITILSSLCVGLIIAFVR